MVFPGLEVTDWACPGCTCANPLTELKCGVCDTKNPNPPKPKEKPKMVAKSGKVREIFAATSPFNDRYMIA